MTERLFGALLKYWRGRSGLSQLDLAVTADVSARHLSFLESGRARPSEPMVLRLLAVLEVPLREQNHLLQAAGFAPRFADPALDAVAPPVAWAIDRMLQQQEPYPLVLLSPDYRILRSNAAAGRLFRRMVAQPERLPPVLDMYSLLFDPALVRPFVVGWERLARRMVARLHREALRGRGDAALERLLARVFQYPEVPVAWRQPDFEVGNETTLSVQFERDALKLGFLTTLTAFSAPQAVTLQELRIESYFPLDEATRSACERLAEG